MDRQPGFPLEPQTAAARGPSAALSVGAHIVALALAVAVPLLVFSAYLIHRDAQQHRELARSSAFDVARNVSAATSEFLDTARGLLVQLADRVPVTADGRIKCDPLHQAYRVLLPRLVNVITVDREGRLVCSGQPYAAESYVPASDTSWFRQALDGQRTVLSPPRMGQITGQWISAYAHPAKDTSGRVVGVMAVAIDLLDFQPGMRAPRLAHGTVAGIVDERGTIVARSADAARWVGRPVPERIVKLMASRDTDASLRFTGLDGEERLYAFARIPDTTWTAYAGIPAQPLIRSETRNLLTLLAVSVAVLLLAGISAMALGRRIADPIRSMAAVARAVAGGKRDRRAPVVGPHEMREVATELNHMLDIRERAEAQQRQLAARLQSLSQRLIEVEETERREINRELHDRIGQNLAILNLNLSMLRDAGPSPQLDARLADAQALAETTMAQVRNVMADLRPPALDDYGLFAALRSFVDSFSARTGLPVALAGDTFTPRLPLATETALFRIAQEALTNAAKHARASRVEVALQIVGRTVTLTVSDDGIGVGASASGTAHASWGLTTMQERATAVGADLRIDSPPGEGTRIAVAVELEAA